MGETSKRGWEILKHACAWGDAMAVRNYFMAGRRSPDDKECQALSDLGLMRRYRQCDDYNGYEVTPAGYDELHRTESAWPKGARAFACRVSGLDEGAVVVFAVSRGKARGTAYSAANDAGFEVAWLDIHCVRVPTYDDAVYRRNGRRALNHCYRPSDLTTEQKEPAQWVRV